MVALLRLSSWAALPPLLQGVGLVRLQRVLRPLRGQGPPFVYTEGVEPTNNLAGRDLRHAVIWRKTSFGTQSEDGSSFVERILTAVMSLRKQERNVLDSLTASLEAHLPGRWHTPHAAGLAPQLAGSPERTKQCDSMPAPHYREIKSA